MKREGEEQSENANDQGERSKRGGRKGGGDFLREQFSCMFIQAVQGKCLY